MTFGVRTSSGSGPGKWSRRRSFFRRGTGTLYRKLQSVRFLVTRDRRAVGEFLAADYPCELPLVRRLDLLRRFYRITHAVRGYHTLAEILTVCDRIFRLAGRPGLTVVECGTGSGSSTAKLSLATRIAGGRLVAFDTFTGIPENDEQHTLLDGRPLVFRRGAFKGRLTAVQGRLSELGAPEITRLVKGLFTDTLPAFDEPVDVVLLDVDLVASTRTCLAHFYPRLRSGGAIFSQDGHIRATVELLQDPDFWRSLGAAAPTSIPGLGVEKLLLIEKP